MSRMGVSPLLPLCAFLLTITLHVNSSPLPKIDSPSDVINEKVKDDIETLFNGTDKNKDGKITLEEFASIPDGGEANKEYNELLFAFADVDRDGVLTLDEFFHFFAQLAPDSNQKVNNPDLRRITDANEQFKIYDTNQDGQISPEEALAMVDHQHSNTKSLSKLATLVLFDKADGDQDSRLKFLEFVMFLTSVEDALKNAETPDLHKSNNNSTEDTVIDYLEAAEGVTGSVPSGSAELADSQPKTAPPEWAPFIQTTTEAPLAVADAVDKALVPPPLIADTSNEFNFTSVDKGSAEAEEEVVADFTTTQSTTTEEMKAETQPFVAGGDFMKDPPPDAEVLASSTESTTATEPTTSALVQDNFRQAEQSSESAIDGKQVDWEKTLTDDKLSPAEELELAALVNQMDETTTAAPSPSSSTGGVLPPSVAPVDIIEEAPSVETAPTSDSTARANKAILEMADQDADNKITMAEAFDFVRVFMRVNDYLILESLFVQNDQDGDRKLNPTEYVAFLKALVDRCSEVTEDGCVEIKFATFGDQAAPVDASPAPIMIDEPDAEAPKDILETSFETSTALPETPSSTGAPLPTDIPVLILQPSQATESENAEDKSDEQPMKPVELSSGEQALIAAMLKEAAQAKSAEDTSSTAGETSKSSEEFVPILIVEPPQDMPHAETLTQEDKERLVELLLQQAGETKPDADALNQSSEAVENIETTSRDPEEFAEKMELIGFGGDVDTTTATQAAPVMSEESEQKLTDVEVMRVSEGDFHYFVRMHNAMYLFFVALIVVLLFIILAVVIARRVYSRREKIYNVT